MYPLISSKAWELGIEKVFLISDEGEQAERGKLAAPMKEPFRVEAATKYIHRGKAHLKEDREEVEGKRRKKSGQP